MPKNGYDESEVVYSLSPSVTNNELNLLFTAAWPNHAWRDFQPILSRSLTFVCAYYAERMVGFVNVAWDGGIHGFILDTTVHPDLQRRGIGRQLVQRAAAAAQDAGLEWLHVDYEPHLEGFYHGCGFRSTAAGLMQLQPNPHPPQAPAPSGTAR